MSTAGTKSVRCCETVQPVPFFKLSAALAHELGEVFDVEACVASRIGDFAESERLADIATDLRRRAGAT